MSDKSQPKATRERLRAGDATLVTILNHPISVNEFHAVILGLVTGAVAAVTAMVGHPTTAVAFAVAVVGYAVLGRPMGHSLAHDDPTYGQYPIGRATLKHEPWWFCGAFVAGAVVAAGVLA